MHQLQATDHFYFPLNPQSVRSSKVRPSKVDSNCNSNRSSNNTNRRTATAAESSKSNSTFFSANCSSLTVNSGSLNSSQRSLNLSQPLNSAQQWSPLLLYTNFSGTGPPVE
uniref:(northern house mosquito) hypothetical protein n=1 Tax=Culex pipiens TaxID=7175 RepID=A0A8D8E8A4_CULPI